MKTVRIAPFKYAFSRYFFVFCLLEEVSLVVHGDRVILGLIVNYVINMLFIWYDYLDGFDFLTLFLEIFEGLLLIIAIICRKKYKPLH